MKVLCKSLMAVWLPLLLAACQGLGPVGRDPQELAYVKMEYVAVLLTYERHVEIEADGTVRVAQRSSREPQDTLMAQGRLTPEQRAELLEVFRGWAKLKTSYGVDWSTVLTISYDDHMVQTSLGDRTPAQVRRAKLVLDRIAQETLRAAGLLPAESQPSAGQRGAVMPPTNQR